MFLTKKRNILISKSIDTLDFKESKTPHEEEYKKAMIPILQEHTKKVLASNTLSSVTRRSLAWLIAILYAMLVILYVWLGLLEHEGADVVKEALTKVEIPFTVIMAFYFTKHALDSFTNRKP